MDVICLEDVAFYDLLDRALLHVKEKEGIKLRDEGKIRFSQPEKK